jgi:hypothetical protein
VTGPPPPTTAPPPPAPAPVRVPPKTFHEFSVPYELDKQIPLSIELGFVRVERLMMTTKTGGAGLLRRGTETKLVLSFDLDAPRGTGEWTVDYQIELLDEKGALVQKHDAETDVENQKKVHNIEKGVPPEMLARVKQVRVRMKAGT